MFVNSRCTHTVTYIHTYIFPYMWYVRTRLLLSSFEHDLDLFHPIPNKKPSTTITITTYIATFGYGVKKVIKLESLLVFVAKKTLYFFKYFNDFFLRKENSLFRLPTHIQTSIHSQTRMWVCKENIYATFNILHLLQKHETLAVLP